MRILLVNTSEKKGGAAVACRRLMTALKDEDVEVCMLVRDRQTDDTSVVPLPKSWRHRWHFLRERLTIWFHNLFEWKNLFAVDIASKGWDITRMDEFMQADIIHLHWINQGMISLKVLNKILDSGKPVVWTMHDMWPLTGICHHARNCDGYYKACGQCPYLRIKYLRNDLSHQVFNKKSDIYNRHSITFIGCSEWICQETGKSALAKEQKIIHIPNAIDMQIFHKEDKMFARKLMGLPQDMKLILFGSAKITDKRKGIDYFVSACHHVLQMAPELKDQIGVVVFGKHSEELNHLIPFTVYPMNYIKEDNRLVELYNAVDVFVTPSLEENLPNIIMEAMACGTPCVGFQIGGIPEMIEHRHNGYVARYKDAEDLASGILWTLQENSSCRLSEEAMKYVQEHYDQANIARLHIDLYKSLLKDHEK